MRNVPSLTPHIRAVPAVQSVVSERIKIARVLCIFFMTFVHIPPGIPENVQDSSTGVFDIVYFIFTRLIGLSSVSLLSVVSGYFIVSSLAKVGTPALVRAKFKTLVVPLISWNLAMLALLAAYGLLTGNWQDMPSANPIGLANALVAVSEWPLVVPLWFLRDLFVCCLFSPILYVALTRFPVATAAVLVAFALFGEDLLILQRPQLMLFFALGMWLRLAGSSEQAIDRIARSLAIGLVAMVAIFLALRIQHVELTEQPDAIRISLDAALRATMAAAFWLLTDLVRKSVLSGTFIRLEPYAFFLFCSHAILFHFGGIIFRRFFGDYGSELFPITFFTLPILGVLGAVIGLQAISRSSILLSLFNAGHRAPPLLQPSRARASV